MVYCAGVGAAQPARGADRLIESLRGACLVCVSFSGLWDPSHQPAAAPRPCSPVPAEYVYPVLRSIPQVHGTPPASALCRRPALRKSPLGRAVAALRWAQTGDGLVQGSAGQAAAGQSLTQNTRRTGTTSGVRPTAR